MKTKKIVIAILLLLVYSNTFSQSTKFFLALDGGLNKLLAHDVDYINGFSFGGKAGYKFSSNFIAGIKMDYSSNKPPNSIYTGSSTITYTEGGESINFGIKAFLMYGNFNPEAKLNPYFLIGAGADMFKSGSAETLEFGHFNGGSFLSNLGLDFAVGMGYKIADNVSTYIEPKFTGSFTGGTSARTSASVKAGVMYSF